MKIYMVLEKTDNHASSVRSLITNACYYEDFYQYEKIDKIFSSKESALKYLENYKLPKSETIDDKGIRVEVNGAEFNRTEGTLSYEYLLFDKFGGIICSYDTCIYITEKEVEVGFDLRHREG